VARNEAQIKAAAQSRYSLAPVNAVLEQLSDTSDRLAVVALPCQAHALRLAQGLDLAFTRRITLIIGLFCGFNLKQQATYYLLRKLDIEAGEVSQLEYRGGPWPGGFRAVTREGDEAFITKHAYTYVNLMYVPEGCWYCPDLTAEHADISVGDYWADKANGHSMVIGRTAAGQTLLEGAAARGEVVIETSTREAALASHGHLLKYKKLGVQVRRHLSGRKPVVGYSLPPLTVKDWLGSTLFYATIRFFSSRLGQWIVGLLPLELAGVLSAKGREMLRK
jgi:coenzyme F420 hydrogenase subunit beta